jgi:chromatin remodeling complex protein RSC6
MPRTKTTKTASETEQVSTSVPVVESQVVAPVVDKSTKTKKTKTTKTEVTSTPVVDTQVVESQVVVTTEDVVENAVENDTPLADQSIEFLAKLQQLGVLISALKTEYRTLEKRWSRELKSAQKASSKKKRKLGNRAPSGFVKPTRISEELAKFLGKEPNTEMARTEVTRDINKYIRNHNLQDKENGRKINPDSKLASLLKLKKTDELTYFNLQRYMSPHFAKATATTAVEKATH